MKKILHIMEDGSLKIKLYNHVPVEELESASDGYQSLIDLDELTHLFDYDSHTGALDWRPIEFDATDYKGEAVPAHPSVSKAIDTSLEIARITIGIPEALRLRLEEIAKTIGYNVNGMLNMVLAEYASRYDDTEGNSVTD